MNQEFIEEVKKDLESCYEALDSKDLSIEEKEFLLKQIQLDKQIVQDYERDCFERKVELQKCNSDVALSNAKVTESNTSSLRNIAGIVLGALAVGVSAWGTIESSKISRQALGVESSSFISCPKTYTEQKRKLDSGVNPPKII